MIKNVKIGKVALPRTPYTPRRLIPLIEVVGAGDPVEAVLTELVTELGFDSFMFGMSASPMLNHESQLYCYTTLSVEWVMRYDQMDYIDIDPRVLKTRESPLPLVWDSLSEHGVDARTDAFLGDAALHGVSSGFAFKFDDVHVHGLMALNSMAPVIDDGKREAIGERLGEILLLGTYFHEIFRKGVIEEGTPPLGRGAPLSERQRECLAMAARGLTTEDIALKLNISARTAQYHFDCIRTKLAAANRQEAVARALAQGLIRP